MPAWVFTPSRMEIPTKGCLKMEEGMAAEPLHIPMEKIMWVSLKMTREPVRAFIHIREAKPIKDPFGTDRKMARVRLAIPTVTSM